MGKVFNHQFGAPLYVHMCQLKLIADWMLLFLHAGVGEVQRSKLLCIQSWEARLFSRDHSQLVACETVRDYMDHIAMAILRSIKNVNL